jgi:hypothetical protein
VRSQELSVKMSTNVGRTRVEVAVGHPEHCGMLPMQSVVKVSYKRCDVRWNMTGCDGHAAEHHRNEV